MNNYSVTFVSLRAGTSYTVNIGGGTGTAIPLKAAPAPLTTDEDDNDDVFMPLREQTGYLRIIDDGYGDNGSAFAWTDLIPVPGSERPVTLTAGSTVVWQGFMQAQTFSGELYGNTQEREFPVMCALGILAGVNADITAGIQNFAYTLKTVCDIIDSKSGNMVHISSVVVQGGYDARDWLLTKVDWQNFGMDDGNGAMTSKYTMHDVLEDMCRFWGWTARTCGTVLYLLATDDSAEQTFWTMTRTQLNSMAGGTSSGSRSTTITTVTLSDSTADPLFATTSQDESYLQGPHKATVKADCNEQDTIAQFAPKDIRDWLDDNGEATWTWVQGEDDLVGYFTTTPKRATNQGTAVMKVTNSAYGRCCRRQIYSSSESENSVDGDMLMAIEGYVDQSAAPIQLQTLRPMSFGGGSLKISGTVWHGSEPISQEENLTVVDMRIGIGMTRESALWWRLFPAESDPTVVVKGWYPVSGGTTPTCFAGMQGNNIEGPALIRAIAPLAPTAVAVYPAIPIPSNMAGYIFIDIISVRDLSNLYYWPSFEIANLELEYSRDSYDLPGQTTVIRPRKMKTKRVTTKEYTAENNNTSQDEWNADCIIASDNNMEYGYGLLLDSNSNILATVGYGGVQEHPEQHLANRVSTFWSRRHSRMDVQLLASASRSSVLIRDIRPNNKASLNSLTCMPIAIGHDWCDDVVTLSLVEL